MESEKAKLASEDSGDITEILVASTILLLGAGVLVFVRKGKRPGF